MEQLIFKKMAEVSKAIGSIGKNAENRQQNFKFRRIDDIYNGVHDALANAEVFCLPKVVKYIKEVVGENSKGGKSHHVIIEMDFTFYASDGSSVTATTWGEAIDYGDKTINKCMSIAHKYALIQCFTIPTEDLPDPDDNAVELKNERPKETKPAPTKQAVVPEKTEQILQHFQAYNVGISELQTYVKKPINSWGEFELSLLRELATRLKNGESIFEIISSNSAKHKINNISNMGNEV